MTDMENQQTPNMELPRPVNNPDGLNLEGVSGGVPELQPTSEAISASSAPKTTTVGGPQSVTSIISNGAAVSAAQSPLITDSPSIADDVDLIEKEWVNKARQIVERSKADPYVQNKELNIFKADYMKKRYGKDIKVASE